MADAKEIFLAALDCATPEELSQFLAEACVGDGRLLARVEQLLAARREAGSFLGGGWTADTAEREPLAEAVGTVIGPYKLVEQIGEGGFGVVFRAEQERPVRRRVALKIIKPGMDTRQVIARFEAERQALALMDHSNIAKVFDAGATSTGRPYFVMELVHGAPLTDYCDECSLTTRERLDLFVAVCLAVQHAHQKGVIHRDIKPTNVLVAIEDGRPVPKVIDFGVAKALSERLTDQTNVTGFAQVIGTPLYMAPEQAELSALGVDTRSDIYSLGVLLYELLTGTTPLDKERVHAAGYEELRRILREEAPPRPSDRLSTLAAERATTVAGQHRTAPRRLTHSVRGELDWIVMKCLEKDRNRRYETANDLARDVERYLADEPVTACPPSVGYRFRTFARRNKVALFVASVAAAALLLLLSGLAISNRMISTERAQAEEQRRLAQQKAADEEHASQLAQAEAAKATAVVTLLQDMLAAAHPDSADGNNYTVRELLDEFSAGLDQRLNGQPELEATLRQIIGSVYTRLGLVDQAERHLRRALALNSELFGERDVRYADSQHYLAWNRLERNRADHEVENLCREALAVYRQHDAADRALQAQWLLVLSLDGQSRTEEAESAAGEALQFAREHGLGDHSTVPSLLHHLAWIHIRQGDYRTAERLARESVEIHERVHGDAHPETAFGWTYLGAALHRQGKLTEAEACYRKSLEVFRRSLPENHSYIRPTLLDLSAALQSQGKSEALIALWRETVRRQPGNATALNDLAWALCTCPEMRLRDPLAAVEIASKAVALEPANGDMWNTLGVAHYRQGNWRDSVDALHKAIELRHGGDSNDWYFLAMAEWRSGNHAVARQWYHKANDWMHVNGDTNKELARFRDEAAELIRIAAESAPTTDQAPGDAEP